MILLGVIIGLLIAILVVILETRYRPDVLRTLEKKIDPQVGKVFFPKTDGEQNVAEILDKAKKEGRDVPFSDLL